MESFHRRLRRPVFLYALLAMLIQIAIELLHGLPGWTALLPLIPMLMFVFALVRMMTQSDELQQRICMQSLSIAFPSAFVLTLVFAGLERAGLSRPPWNEMGTYMMGLWATAYLFASRRYRC
jgi:hypothetical protein